jgi:hypothetical protein
MPLQPTLYNGDTALDPQFIVRVVESADAADMERRLRQVLKEVEAINADIQSDPEKFVYQDIDLAGAGDGHVFAATIIFVREADDFFGFALTPDLLAVGAYMASQQEAIEAAHGVTVRRLIALSQEDPKQFFAVSQPVRGAAGGTRFMGVILGAIAEPNGGT